MIQQKYFKSKKLLRKHYKKHGKSKYYNSIDYLRNANLFLRRRDNDVYLTKNNNLKYFNHKTRETLILDPLQNAILTFYVKDLPKGQNYARI